MPQTQTQPEPSMEEILASIRRIISEEEGGEESTADSVLDLTQQAEEEASDDLLVFDAPPPAPVAPTPRAIAPSPASRGAPVPAPAPTHMEAIISQPATRAASGSLNRLAGALRIAETQGQTIEGVVREMLTPLLKDWLDQNLPAIVEAKVEAELERIARLAR